MTAPGHSRSTRLGRISWCLYDWANSAFPSVVITFVFAAYFTKGIATDPVTGASEWGYALSLSALAVAVAGPVLGAVADRSGGRKPWLFVMTALCVASASLLWYALPDPSFALWALFWVAIANFAFEMGMVFYNAMLPDLVPRSHLGRYSGWGWGLGYGGGLVCLLLVLVGFVQPETPWFGIETKNAENIRIVAPLAALWFAVFSLPLFLWTPDRPPTGIGALRAVAGGFRDLRETIAQARRHAGCFRFLIARMIYTDGLNTLFAFGGIYAAGTFAMDFEEIIIFGIAMNVTAGLGAVLFAWVDDFIGPKRTIMIAVAGLTVLGGALLAAQTKTFFWVFALPLGLFIGPAQSAGRSMMAHMAPEEIRTEMFGLYALSGKATSFLGPALLAWVTAAYGSQRAGMATILVFFVLGLILMGRVPDVRR